MPDHRKTCHSFFTMNTHFYLPHACCTSFKVNKPIEVIFWIHLSQRKKSHLADQWISHVKVTWINTIFKCKNCFAIKCFVLLYTYLNMNIYKYIRNCTHTYIHKQLVIRSLQPCNTIQSHFHLTLQYGKVQRVTWVKASKAGFIAQSMNFVISLWQERVGYFFPPVLNSTTSTSHPNGCM